MNSRSEVATDRMRSDARAWVIANDGPKNTAAISIRPTNDGNATDRFGDRYARNWNGTHSSVAMPGTHRYQRRSFFNLLRRSAANPPRNVPRPAISDRMEIQLPASPTDMACDRCRNALLNAPLAYQTTE